MNEKDQQFIDAMHQVVAEKGSDHTAEGMYWGGSGPECIVGCAAWAAWGTRLPETAMAEAHLGRIGCTAKVSIAARIAQSRQDAREEWGNVLGMFDLALEMYDEQDEKPVLVGCTCCSQSFIDLERQVAEAYLLGRRAQSALARKDHALVA